METDQVRILERRVHGVRATQPWESLGLSDPRMDQLCSPKPLGAHGSIDDKTGFYCCLPSQKPVGINILGLHVEAYSWGGLTSGRVKRFGEAITRSLWLLLAPFAFVNVAMWSRSQITKPGPTRAVTAVIIRWVGLLLTCLLVATICGIVMDLVAWQCFRHGNAYCADFLSPLFARQPAVERLVLAALTSSLAILGLFVVSRQTMRKTEATTLTQPAPELKPDRTHLLRRGEFWNGMERVSSLVWLHLAAGLSIISLSATAPVLAIEGVRFWPVPWPVGASAVILLATFVLDAIGVLDQIEYQPSSTLIRLRRQGPVILFAFSLALFLADLLWLWAGHRSLDQNGELPFTADTQIAIAGLLFALVFVLAAVLTAVWFAWVAFVVICSFVALNVMSPSTLRDDFYPVLGLLAIAYCGGLFVHFRARRRHRHEKDALELTSVAWFGLAPTHLLAFAIFLAVMYSSVATLVAASFLNGSFFNPGALTQSTPGTDVGEPVSGQGLTVPSPFLWFALCFVPGMAAAVVTGGVLLLLFLGKGKGELKKLATTEEPDHAARVTTSRFWAALLHRIEALLGALALIPLSAAVLSTAGMLSAQEPFWPELVTVGVWAAVISGLSIAVIIGISLYHEEVQRIVGVLWDVATFWPRTAQPFSPPCYGERVVPELVDRVRAALSGRGTSSNGQDNLVACKESDPDGAAARYDYVLLSGHSLGSAILAAVILQLSDTEISRIRFVSYGSQLRAWFGRFFPDLLGPAVLGHEKSLRPEFWNSIPDAPLQHGKAIFTPPEGSLMRLLEGSRNWRNYFRRSDPLGFRVFQDTENDVDHRLSEWDPSDPRSPVHKRKSQPLHTHGRYQESQPYVDLVQTWIDAAKVNPERFNR